MSNSASRPLAPLGPLGLGSGDVEAQSGILVRLARAHSVLTPTIATDVYGGKLGTNRPHSINGHGTQAREIARNLSERCQTADIWRTTLLAWSEILDPSQHYLLSSHRKWCASCLASDRLNGDDPYQRLYWCLRDAKVCVHHRIALASTCSACGARQSHLPRLPFLDACEHCGADLAAHQQTPDKPAASQEDLWSAMSIHDFLHRSQDTAEPLKHEILIAWLRQLTDHHAAGDPGMLARLAGIGNANFRRWLTGESRPALPSLLHLCFVLRCPPASIITGQPLLIDRALTQSKPFALRQATQWRTEAELQRMRLILEDALGEDPPPSLNHVARRANSNLTYVRVRFPGLAGQIVDNARLYRLQRAEERAKVRLSQAFSVLFRFLAEGIYPSDRHLCNCGGLPKTYTRRPELRRLIQNARRAFHDRQVSPFDT